jgi:hypothetical protein
MQLTEVKVRNAKGRAAPYKLADGGALYLLVQPNGARYWRMDYRWHGGTLVVLAALKDKFPCN